MPKLNCLAMKCMYNQDEYCSKTDIEVSGSNAQTSDETNCASFRERGEGSAMNSCGCGQACAQTDVDCEAHECMYNEQAVCHAGSVDIMGGNASVCEETNCGTFQAGR